MMFLQFAILGSYITSFGGYLASVGLAGHIGPFYAIGGIIAILLPALMGMLADRKISSQKLYGILHLLLGISLSVFGFYCSRKIVSGSIFVSLLLYSTIPLLVIPTIPLSYSTIFAVLKKQGGDEKEDFPRVRVLGTVGFIFSMLAVDFLGIQHSHIQFYVGALFAFILSAWSLGIPDCPPVRREVGNNFVYSLSLFKNRSLAVFYILTFCLGMLEKISEAYTNPFFTSLSLPHPNAVLSVSRVAEVVGILLIPMMLRTFGIKRTIAVAIFSWTAYYGCLGLGGATGQVWPLLISMLSYGSAFSFFSISGSIFVENSVDVSLRSTAQGVMSVMTNGIGAVSGAVFAQWLFDSVVPSSAGWGGMWYVLSAFSILVAVLFLFLFKEGKSLSLQY